MDELAPIKKGASSPNKGLKIVGALRNNSGRHNSVKATQKSHPSIYLLNEPAVTHEPANQTDETPSDALRQNSLFSLHRNEGEGSPIAYFAAGSGLSLLDKIVLGERNQGIYDLPDFKYTTDSSISGKGLQRHESNAIRFLYDTRSSKERHQ